MANDTSVSEIWIIQFWLQEDMEKRLKIEGKALVFQTAFFKNHARIFHFKGDSDILIFILQRTNNFLNTRH